MIALTGYQMSVTIAQPESVSLRCPSPLEYIGLGSFVR